ncbi:MAG TPA: RsmB/NOP family class I SAM-dependent RNA methyltransferase [Rhizomicrobium sp.]|nr:RsmB/NOP family class I SAM-dependent RNA methyltransferase [Rhizomicrobium sp.]
MTPSARLQAAIEIVEALQTSRLPADRMLREFFRARRYAGSKDRAAVAEWVFDVFRHRGAYEWRMGATDARALAIAALLAQGADPAALFTGGYGPAPLTERERAAIATPPAGEPPLWVRGEYPQFLEAELKRTFGERLLAEMLALQARAPVDLRVNTLKASREDVLAALRSEGYDASPTRHSHFAIRLPSGTKSLDRTGLFESGAFEFQDEAAQVAVMLADAKPGMAVLDIAAGAGGKALALAAAMENRGEIVVDDIDEGRLRQIAPRAARAGVTIIRAAPPDGRLFDRAFVDAPCSGTGTWRRQPENRWRLTPARLAELMATQDALLARAARHVRPGGLLVYATCSVLPCENDDRIAAFVAANSAFAIRGDAFRASPHSTGTDGFFAAVLTRAA